MFLFPCHGSVFKVSLRGLWLCGLFLKAFYTNSNISYVNVDSLCQSVVVYVCLY